MDLVIITGYNDGADSKDKAKSEGSFCLCFLLCRGDTRGFFPLSRIVKVAETLTLLNNIVDVL